MTPCWALGLMTGTVLDGMVDLALIRSDGEQVQEFGPWALMPYATGIRSLLAECLRQAVDWGFSGPEPAIFAEAEAAITQGQAQAVREFLTQHGIRPRDLRVIGFHGQTVLHRPPTLQMRGRTRQLGDGKLLAELTGVEVVSDFRSADVAAGGQGAPLSAIYHRALLSRLPGVSAVLNLGGVANLTWCGETGKLAAFDTGPANAPINDWVEQATGAPMDVDGALARRGSVDEARLQEHLADPYFAAPYPKSLDRFAFTSAMAKGLSVEDGAAQLTAFSAAAVGLGLDLLPVRPTRLVVCGGGRKNPALMDALRDRAKVEPVQAQDVGWRGDAIEAECFAFLAIRRLRSLPSSFPETTGAAAPTLCGRISPRPTV